MYSYQRYQPRHQPRYQVAPQAPRRNLRHHAQPVFQFYAPDEFQHDSLYYEPQVEYGYDDYTEEPSDLELLAIEEERLREQERYILNQRRRIAEEKRRIQIEKAQDQERLRQQQLYQEAAWRREQQLAQQQQQARRRRNAIDAREDAQLEAALRELDSSLETYVVPYSAPTAQKKRDAKVERTVNPIEAFLREAFGVASAQQKPATAPKPKHTPAQKPTPSTRQQLPPPAAPPCNTQRRPAYAPASECGHFCVPAFVRSKVDKAPSQQRQQVKPAQASSSRPTPYKPAPKASSSNAASSSASTPAPAAPKPVSAFSLLENLKQRVASTGVRVSELLHTSFADLNLRLFGTIDNELMQLLLALDNVNVDNDETRTQRKALVTETVSLIEKVDEFKDAFSASSSDASSSPDSEVSEELDSKQDTEVPADSSSASLAVPSSVPVDIAYAPVLSEIDDLKSAAFQVPQLEESVNADESQNEVEAPEEIDADERASQQSAESDEEAEDSQAEVDGQDHDDEEVAEASQVQSPALDSSNSDPALGHSDDPFGLKALASPSMPSSPIPVHAASKSNVVIESAPASN